MPSVDYAIPNSFLSHSLTDEEIRQGSILTTTQQQVIQNYLAMVAEEKIRLVFDPADPQAFIQREAGLAAQLQTYQFLLEQSVYASDPANYLNAPQT